MKHSKTSKAELTKKIVNVTNAVKKHPASREQVRMAVEAMDQQHQGASMSFQSHHVSPTVLGPPRFPFFRYSSEIVMLSPNAYLTTGPALKVHDFDHAYRSLSPSNDVAPTQFPVAVPAPTIIAANFGVGPAPLAIPSTPKDVMGVYFSITQQQQQIQAVDYTFTVTGYVLTDPTLEQVDAAGIGSAPDYNRTFTIRGSDQIEFILIPSYADQGGRRHYRPFREVTANAAAAGFVTPTANITFDIAGTLVGRDAIIATPIIGARSDGFRKLLGSIAATGCGGQ